MAFLQVVVWVSFFAAVDFFCTAAAGPSLAGEQQQEDAAYWNRLAKDSIKESLRLRENNNIARNVIMFLGDGMSIPTLVAARIYKGQQQSKRGEEGLLFFEKFPRVALIKTYNVDRQVPDSAGTATAFLCGVKANYETIGLDATAVHGDCSTVEKAKVKSVVNWAQEAGKATGVVTTTTITHATPAGAYAHTPNRDWEADADMIDGKSNDCKDIARQLIEDLPGRDLNVIFGGGRGNFFPNDSVESSEGRRADGRVLVDDWTEDKKKRNATFRYVSSNDELKAVDLSETEYLMGLFSKHHMDYEYVRKKDNSQPSLKDMTTAAIKVLKNNPNGFFLLVEGGRIDHAHHDGHARRALDETLAMEEAVKASIELTDSSDTLVIVTADHAHVMTVNGYPVRGNNILGFADVGTDRMPFTTLMYTNGPGFNFTETGERVNLTNVNTSSWDFFSPAAVHLDSETHGGDDVAIYAQGPMAHLFHSLHEQNYVAHVMAYAACMGPYANDCHRESVNAASISKSIPLYLALILQSLVLILCYTKQL